MAMKPRKMKRGGMTTTDTTKKTAMMRGGMAAKDKPVAMKRGGMTAKKKK